MRTDVCIITEGSYPYVVGGVSSWVHDLISSLSDVSFSLMYIGVSRDLAGPMRYELPKNVLEYKEVHLMETFPWRGPSLRSRKKAFKELEEFIYDLKRGDLSRLPLMLRRFEPGAKEGLTPYDIFHHKGFWEILVKVYRDCFDGFSFIDFFWNIRFIALPIFRVLYADVPKASLYHATCTGYAGLLGTLASMRQRVPLIITEHGIYTNERMIEITQAQWIYRERRPSAVPTRQIGALQNLWMRKFEILSQIAYNAASAIFTLYEGNRQMQIASGADPKKTFLIPNGIALDRFDEIYRRRLAMGEKKEPLVAFVGRVSPIKDVKTFIRAAKIVSEKIPSARFLVLGPTDEDPSYFEECERLVRILELQKHLKFMGSVDMKEYYPKIDCVVLTSISEAQPFVILEAMRAGVPVVATNVGACAELLLGQGPEDEALGPAGIITNIRSPKETAQAIISILEDPKRAREMGEAGHERVGRYYDRVKMLEAYRDVYRRFCGSSNFRSNDRQGPTFQLTSG